MTAIHGWIIMDKPLGITSAGGVARVKRLMREHGIRKPKVGHGGTLDPLATGVLPIALGEATKLTGRMLNGDKGYDFTITFGSATATDDLEGDIVEESAHRPSLASVQDVLPQFTGPITQRPPAYSALKVDGERAYKRARAGEVLNMAERGVTVHELIISTTCGAPPDADALDQITLSATVSKGTYVRALARDIAVALGTAGHVSMLRRTACGPFALESAITLDNLMESAMERGLESVVLPMTTGLDDIPALPVTAEEAGILRHGQQLSGCPEPDGLKIAMMEEIPVALVAVENGIVRVERGFNL
ncbi:tRNA pseudouridine(55) synthase TruB [Pacificimonas sp. WHA3]|uniref:tRNA pseudouridine synthase B n=1 Tax=Pacificimonas pallii TaxID=2827236 RepID=A0ABS6SC70_9SPHN|nr:tRNA pseudouridine(55) synthase TruB [Pacificimonas pallii]MBV7255955.1 tRNA pseudouridine(55) synthase TruB [Pacificimonas pallii]